MTSYVAGIRTALRTVVSDKLATTLEYRLLTSGYGVDTRTYSASWTSIGAVVTKYTARQEFDDHRAEYVRKERVQIRTSDAVELKQGDQFRLASTNDQIWNVDERASGGPGSYLYMCVRDIPTITSGGDRGGGV